MAEEEFVLAIMGMISGTVIVSVFFAGLFGVIKAWLNRSKSEQEIDPQFFKALTQFKRDAEFWLSNLESIATDTNEIETSSNRGRMKNG